MKVWTYRGKRTKEVGIVIQAGDRKYYKIPSYCLENIFKSSNKKKRLTIERLKLTGFISKYNIRYCFPADLCKPKHFLQSDIIYWNEVRGLLKKLK